MFIEYQIHEIWIVGRVVSWLEQSRFLKTLEEELLTLEIILSISLVQQHENLKQRTFLCFDLDCNALDFLNLTCHPGGCLPPR